MKPRLLLALSLAVGACTGTESTGKAAPPETGDSVSACTKNVVVMGYWPPTNEMLRQWSTNRTQNPGRWKGENWRKHGYDVYSYFPEFPPDGDPSNDSIGDPGAVGSPQSDLQVDYQDTSADFWRIVDDKKPLILITTSRGGSIGWEIEAVEGGHGAGKTGDPSLDWTSDGYGDVKYPTQATIERRSWQAITTHRTETLPSQLPTTKIYDATNALGLVSVQVENGTSGNFLSGFLGLHGLYYNEIADHNVAAGHIHVGIAVPVAEAVSLIETTLETVLEAHPANSTGCSADAR